ncbi:MULTISPECIES: NAD(P)H-dependent oxidoreductase [unclassified Pseudomonas]|uniref:FMN-dependent NADH-azoreductase n=1 Tax=unclassified Pseudomonas TaxID=196821 RepID=UPI00244AFCEE|nr:MULTISPECIES: NAD(P)H-dependent oxidoreductase [unclassified Pseudomonas]MDG9925277.1 NAD(P)H-dependent oxidoreductase [Pseudomonas sp. GD04045]MDH0036068.1 NAD(P)H-dependent oxidoreductase [Pseudomonas sp. GD04019]
MPHILHLDASARPGLAGKDLHGSHSRNLSQRFVSQWLARRAQDSLTYRDIGQNPPTIIDHDWIAAAFTADDQREPWMNDALQESELLITELLAADVLVIGTPLYNFSMPAALKAWIDQIVRTDRTVAFDASNPLDPYIPLLADRPRHAVILAARGGVGFDAGGAMAHMNHLESSLITALGFIGITRVHQIAIEGQEVGGELLAASVAQAMGQVDALVEHLQQELQVRRTPEPA